MKIQIPEIFLQALERNISELQDENNPFYRKDEETYVRYDKIEIFRAPDETFYVSFKWKNDVIMTHTANLEPGATMHITGISGSTGVRLM